MSSLLEPDSSYARSATAESSTTSQTCEKKWKAPVWQYCRRPTADKEHQDRLYCSYCLSDSTADGYKEPYSSINSTNIRKHILGAHQIVVEKRVSAHETNDLDAQILKDHLNKAVITKALISLIIVRNLPYATIEWPEFYTLCQALNQQCAGMITTTHSKIALRVEEAWNTHKDIVRREL